MPSTVISHFNYNPDTLELKIMFVTGKVYLYSKVPHIVFEQFKAAISKGKYFNNHIKDHYSFHLISEPK